jgi:parvulin-like peptidyl-prolyl isomerase
MLPIPLAVSQEAEQAKQLVKARAEAIYREALSGVNFDELVERNMDPATRSANQAGQMGWVGRGALESKELEDLLFSLDPGEVGGPIEDQFSYHIVKVIEKRPSGIIPFEELKPEILEYLLNVNTERLFVETLQDLRRKAKVEIMDPTLAEAWPAFEAKLNDDGPSDPTVPPENLSGPPVDPSGPETESSSTGAD